MLVQGPSGVRSKEDGLDLLQLGRVAFPCMRFGLKEGALGSWVAFGRRFVVVLLLVFCGRKGGAGSPGKRPEGTVRGLQAKISEAEDSSKVAGSRTPQKGEAAN